MPIPIKFQTFKRGFIHKLNYAKEGEEIILRFVLCTVLRYQNHSNSEIVEKSKCKILAFSNLWTKPYVINKLK